MPKVTTTNQLQISRQHLNIHNTEKELTNQTNIQMCRAMLGYELEHMVDVFDVQQTEQNVYYNINRFELFYMNRNSIFTSRKQRSNRINRFNTK